MACEHSIPSSPRRELVQPCYSRWNDLPASPVIQEPPKGVSRQRIAGRRSSAPADIRAIAEVRACHQRRKSVSFGESVSVRKVESFAAEENHSVLWYTKEDYIRIQDENRATYKLLRNGYPERFDFCFRGLENNSRKYIVQAWDLIVSNQDGDRLAEQYERHSYSARIEAYQRGLFDAHDAKGTRFVGKATDANPRKPRRTYAAAC